jgi:hypothetical protein
MFPETNLDQHFTRNSHPAQRPEPVITMPMIRAEFDRRARLKQARDRRYRARRRARQSESSPELAQLETAIELALADNGRS